ncbi:uncharacterized protein TNCV_2692341 [Trichonephila clavipes]|uniref:Uncharacterized protein n=1 Tax=Trichonephila clavipes TaxID=2585209 RepID=A0A8X6VYR9_TRICX|nr:uncharacterized protein TNCV_2692341 [Trichonephila clavipes]
MLSGRSLPQINLGVQGGIREDSHSGAQRNLNPELRVGSSFRGHLIGRAMDWFDVLGYRVVEDKATDYAQLKHAFTERFLVIHKNLKLEMAEEKLLDHTISRLEPQLLEYGEVRQPQITSSLLQVIDKYDERFLNRMTRGPSHDFRNTNHSANNQFLNRNRQVNWQDN